MVPSNARRPLGASDPIPATEESPSRNESTSNESTSDALLPGSDSRGPTDDANEGGWVTEVVARQLSDQLRLVGKSLANSDAITAGSLGDILSKRSQSSPLVPELTQEVYRDSRMTVTRGKLNDATVFRTRDPVVRELNRLRKAIPPSDAAMTQAKFKLFRVSLSGDQADSSAYLTLSSHDDYQSIQITATWQCRWRLRRTGVPILQSIKLSDFERVRSRIDGDHHFSDCTEAVIGHTVAFLSQLRYGVDYWAQRIETRMGINVGGWQGITVGDINGDGLEDVYVCQPGGLPNRLFVQNDDGTAREVAADRKVDCLDATHAALLIDLDNDGDQDLVLSVLAGLYFMENNGQGFFALKQAKLFPAAIPYSMCAADYDSDGDLDLYCCCYNRRQGAGNHILFARPVPYHDANNGGRNVLLQNEGGWKFRHVTRQVGLDENNRRFSYAAAWDDYDEDGDLDLSVANDFGRNNLYENVDGQFTDVALKTGVEDVGPGMSSSWGDFDNDGRVDLYISNMFSAAGNRVAFQERFQKEADAKTLGEFRRHARGNTLFRNLGNGQFADVSLTARVSVGRWAWGSKLVDLNNDGWLDIVVTNGFMTQEDSTDL